jgi:glyoxylase-like metal-dependent hydrolase (beta-lactamase superfamily II)
MGYYGKARGLSDGEEIKLGQETITFRSTPGHTPGSGIYLCQDFAFVGDTVFEGGGYGRWDLPGGNYSDLTRSIDFILGLSEDIKLFPGHGTHTSVGEFKKDYRRF